MIGSWAFIGQRIRASKTGVSHQIHLLHNFFLYMGCFFVLMALPHTMLSWDAEKFPQFMAWGYVVGHIFLYLALIMISRMTFSIVPRLASKEVWVTVVGLIATIAITWVNAATMIFGQQPTYDYEQHLTLFNAAPIVGAAIGIFAAVAVLPAAILFIADGIKNTGHRVRSWLLGGGLFLLMTAGPLHDIARTWQLYMIADILSMVSIILVGGGVVYRMEQSFSLAKSANAPSST